MGIDVPLEATRKFVLIGMATAVILFGAGFGVVLPALQSSDTIPAANGIDANSTDLQTNTTTAEPADDTSLENSSGRNDTKTTTGTNSQTRANGDIQPVLTFTISKPTDIASRDGSVSQIQSSISGQFEWSGGTPDAVELTLSTKLPGGDWTTIDRTTVSTTSETGSIDLSSAFGSTITLASGDRAATLRNTQDGTSLVHPVHVRVHASVHRSGSEVATATDTATTEVTVTNLDRTDSDDDEVKTFEAQSSGPDLEFQGAGATPTIVSATGVVPGDTGSDAIQVRNVGDTDGVLSIALEVSGAENGWTEPEAEVDTDAGPEDEGELIDGLYIRAALLRPDGGADYLIGDAETYVALDRIEEGKLHGAAEMPAGTNGTLVVEWKLASFVGNEAQSDSATMDLDLVLRSESDRQQFSLAGTIGDVLDGIASTAPGGVHVEQSISPWQPHVSAPSDTPKVYPDPGAGMHG